MLLKDDPPSTGRNWRSKLRRAPEVTASWAAEVADRAEVLVRLGFVRFSGLGFQG